MSIDSNLGPTGTYGPTGPVGPEGDQGTDILNPLLMSTLSPSQQEQLMVLYLMNFPILVQPNMDNTNNQTNYTTDISAIGAIVASRFEEIGSDLWDKYLDYLAEQKERIREELESPRYRAWVEDHKTPEMKNEIRSSTEYNEWLNSLPAGEREDELLRNQASDLWVQYIDGTSNYISNVRDTNPQAASFMVASFVITSAFIGDYMNIVDVASTDMVAVNPIQDAVNNVSIIPPNFQDSMNLTINLFVVGALYSSGVELVPKIKGGDSKELDFEAAKAYASEVADKVEGNEINYFLMALLVNSTEEGAPITNERLNQLAAIVKVMMIAVALALLYKVEAGWLKGEDFRALVQGELEPRSEEEARLVGLLRELQDSGVLSEETWDNLMEGLTSFFDSNPKVEDMLNPARVYAAVNSSLPTTEAKG